jgi:hypothetical protein
MVETLGSGHGGLYSGRAGAGQAGPVGAEWCSPAGPVGSVLTYACLA